MIERLKQFFSPTPQVETKTEKKAAFTNPGAVIAPVFKEIPPEVRAGEFIQEGLKSWSYIAISAIADEIFSTKLKLFAGNDANSKEVEQHAALTLLKNPNRMQTYEEFMWLLSVFLLAEGEAPMLLDRDRNPTEMVLINPARLTAIYNDDKGEVDQYRYRKTDGTEQMIDASLILFLKFPNPDSPFRGKGIMEYIRSTIQVDLFTEEYLRVFFYNDATPGAVLETDKELNQGIVTRLRKQFEQRHKGLKNAHKMAVLEKGLKWRETSPKLNEMDYVNLNNTIRDKVLAAYKVPKSVVGITTDVNRANGENEDRIFARRSIKPKLALIDAQFNKFLLPKFAGGENMYFQYENPVADDVKAASEVDQTYINAGVYTAEEVRERLGMGPMPEQEQEEEPKEPEEEPKEEAKRYDPLKDHIKDILRTQNVFKSKYESGEVNDYHRQKIQFSDDLEAKLQEKLLKYFNSVGININKQLNRKAVEDLGIDFHEEEERAKLEAIVKPDITEAVIRQSGLTYALIGVTDEFKPTDAFVKTFIQSRLVKMSESVTDTTKEAVTRIIREWEKEEETIANLKQRLRDYFKDSSRAEIVARTEVSRANGFATSEVYAQTGAVGKQWVTAQDERVCQFCGPMDGTIIPLKDNFWNKGESMTGIAGGKLGFGFESVKQYPLHPQCRCNLIPIYDETLVPKKSLSYKSESDQRTKAVEEFETKQRSLEEKENLLANKEAAIEQKEGQIETDVAKLEKAKEIIVGKNREVDKKAKEIEQQIAKIEKEWTSEKNSTT